MATAKGWIVAVLAFTCVACGKSEDGKGSFQTVGRQPDIAPVMLNKELPFRYPPALFAQKVQGNVILRIFIDRNGLVVPESTHVAETSGFSALDSAAVKGSHELQFTPATTERQPVPVSILLPIFFRYPGAPPLPGDTVLKGREISSSTPVATDTVSDTAPKPAAKATSSRRSRTRKKRR